MKKKDLEELEQQIKDDNVSEENIEHLKSLCIYKSFTILGILFLIFLISVIFSTRIIRFSHLFVELFFEANNVGAVIYYTLLVLGMGYYGFIGVFSLIKYKKDEHWYKICYKVYNVADIPLFIVKATLCVVFIAIYIITPCNVSGPSMNDTLKDSDKLLLWNLFYSPKDNDIVVFDATGIDYGGKESFFIKRVAATSGDLVEYDILNNNLLINGESIQTSNPLQHFKKLKERGEIISEYSFTVPKGYLIVLGDNRDVSHDSRYFGMIESSRVYGKVILRIFPFDKFGTVN